MKVSEVTKFLDSNLDKLDLYTTAITRAHGKNHPEAFDVREIFEKISSKVAKAGAAEFQLNEEFQQLRKVTTDYKVPEDVCETFEAVYVMLKEFDDLYQNS